MKEALPEAFEQFVGTMQRLEEHYRDMQDIEFTVEDGRLYLLQTRSAKRTAAAALKSAVDMVDEGLISREDAVIRIDPGQLDQLLHPMIDPSANLEVVAQGLNASPGAASGKIVFDADTAAERGKNGDSVILVRWETTPDDIHGMIAAQGILTAHGGMTSHAAVVARGMGKPCVAGCEALTVDTAARTAALDGHQLAEGDVITIDGGTGRVMLGPVELVPPQINEDFETILGWADDMRRLKVRANADTPEDAAKAREFGAQGIGLCRTEHMFMAEDRLPVVREMIMASSEDERRRALDRLLPHQQADFEGIFEAMAGLPVTIRLLDPPLHEFLPPLEEATDEQMRERIRALREANPMLGTRGCRLGLMWPEIYEMQVRAIVRAALAVQERTGDAPLVEIMHPLVGFAEELRRLREMTIATADEEGELEYLVGTMIELPRACVRADEIAEHADFFSFGTNDLTQTALGFSRDDAEGKFLTRYLEDGVLERNPFETIDQGGVGDLMRIAVERGRSVEGHQDGHLRRARRRAEVGRVLPRARPRVRVVLAVPRPARAPRRGPGRARGVRDRSSRVRRLGREALHAEVGDQDARHPDRDHPGDSEQARAPVDRMRLAEAREREHAQRAADQPADVAADRDVRDREREYEVDGDQAERLTPEHVVLLTLEDERRAEDPEDRARRADRDDVRAEDDRAGRAGEPRHDVDREEPSAPDRLLDRRADEPEDEHVEQEVDQARVQERRRDQAIPLALVQAARHVEGAFHEEAPGDLGEARALSEVDQEDEDVDPDQDLRDERALALVGDAPHALGHP